MAQWCVVVEQGEEASHSEQQRCRRNTRLHTPARAARPHAPPERQRLEVRDAVDDLDAQVDVLAALRPRDHRVGDAVGGPPLQGPLDVGQPVDGVRGADLGDAGRQQRRLRGVINGAVGRGRR